MLKTNGVTKKLAYKGVNRGDGDEENKEGEEEREQDLYVDVVSKQTELFTPYDAETVLM